MQSTEKLVDTIIDAVDKRQSKKAKSYDTPATVTRVEGSTAYVHIPGGVDETPASLTVNAKKGDTVQVRVGGGKAWLVGNASAPPTDNAVANAAIARVAATEQIVATKADIVDLRAVHADIDDLEADTAKIHDLTAEELSATVGYIGDLTADEITAQDISAATGYVGDLTTGNVTAQNLIADHGTIGSLNTNYARINAANITESATQNAWINQLLVNTGLLAHSGTIYTLDAIQVNASNITAGTIDVERLIVTVDGEKYLVHIDTSTGTPTYEKLDGDVIEDLTITADKIVAGAITADKITTNNLVGTNGWINLHQGTFFYGDGADWASCTQGIKWDGTSLLVKGALTVTSGSNVYTKAEADTLKPLLANSPSVETSTTKSAYISPTNESLSLYTGLTVAVRFNFANENSGALSLNLYKTSTSSGALGAKAIYYNGNATSSTNPLYWDAGATITFVYDGVGFVVVDAEGLKALADAAEAAKVATNYLTFDGTNGLDVGASGLSSKVNIKSDGVRIYDGSGNLGNYVSASGMVVYKGGNSVASFGDPVIIGENISGKLRTEIKPAGMGIVRKTSGGDVALANIGYGSGTAASGTADAPYFTFGERASGSTIGNYSMAEGLNVTARGYTSHAEGQGTTSSGGESHAEGYSTTASGTGSHAEGYSTTASGVYSHAEGQSTTASGDRSHAEGQSTTASGAHSHAEGKSTTASGVYSHAGGLGTIASQYYQTAIGQYNVNNTSASTGDTWKLFIIGNGTSSSRSDAFNVAQNGNVRMALDTSATSGVDKDLYAAINALGWASSVID